MMLFLGRAAKVVVVLTADLFVYMALLSFFLRFGPSGLGPRLFQLGMAVALPAVLTYRTLWKRRARFVTWRPLAGLASASLLTPSLLQAIPMLSLAGAMALAMAPYYGPRHLQPLLIRAVRRAGRAEKEGEGHVRLDLLLIKRHIYYFRWWGSGVPARRGNSMVRAGGQDYLRVRRTAFSDEACRKKALAGALEAAKAAPGVIVPATREEVTCLERRTELEERVIALAMEERVALAPLAIAGRRRLTCALEGTAEGNASAADVLLRNDGKSVSVKLLSARAMTMSPQRLRDLLDAYGMIVARG